MSPESKATMAEIRKLLGLTGQGFRICAHRFQRASYLTVEE